MITIPAIAIPEVGYGYRVEFTIDGADEAKGTVLFSSDNATFYLADPESGQLGFAHEGYLNKFNYRVEKGRKVTLAITGDNKKTCLYVNDNLVRSPFMRCSRKTWLHYRRAMLQPLSLSYIIPQPRCIISARWCSLSRRQAILRAALRE